MSITYASDWATQGTGVFLDDVTVTVDGAVGGRDLVRGRPRRLDRRPGPPEGSVANTNDWIRTQLGFEEGAVTTTEDTVYAGFGFEGLAPAERDDLVARSDGAPVPLTGDTRGGDRRIGRPFSHAQSAVSEVGRKASV